MNQADKHPILQIEQLNHFFGKGGLRKQILFDITLEIQTGEIVIMMGPSGSGKTTLLTLIGALRSVQEGSVKVFGQELYGATIEELIQVRRRIGYIFQSHNLLRFLTARQNVRTSLDLHDEFSLTQLREQSRSILTAVGLEEQVDDYPDNLSGGQKQRVAIARALVAHPQLVLADEPTAALDSKSGRNVVQLMQQLAKEQGAAILIVTHDNRILDIAERIISLEDGRLFSDQPN